MNHHKRAKADMPSPRTVRKQPQARSQSQKEIAPIPEFQQWQEGQAIDREKKQKALLAVAATAKQSRERARPTGSTAGRGGKEAFGKVVVDTFGEPSFACALANTLVCRNTWVKAG